jgi:serine/threonine protein phosphatase PrpC
MVKDLAGIKGLWMLGVMDGHGANGHLVSDLVKKNLPNILANLINGTDINHRKSTKLN